MNLGVSGQCGWPDRQLEVIFGGQNFVLMPQTKENSASIHLETKSNDQLHELTAVNRFLSVVSWADSVRQAGVNPWPDLRLGCPYQAATSGTPISTDGWSAGSAIE
ncbi:MAG: hypothetical protein AB7U30_12210, partial [Sulfuricellaceae bacterium]